MKRERLEYHNFLCKDKLRFLTSLALEWRGWKRTLQETRGMAMLYFPVFQILLGFLLLKNHLKVTTQRQFVRDTFPRGC